MNDIIMFILSVVAAYVAASLFNSKQRKHRMLYVAIIAFAIIGMLLDALFFNWFVSPGSIYIIYFMMMISMVGLYRIFVLKKADY